MWTSPLDVVLCSLLSHAVSQVRRQGDLGDEVGGIKGETVELLDDDDGCRKRGVPSGHLARHISRNCLVDPPLIANSLMVCGLAAASGRQRRRRLDTCGPGVCVYCCYFRYNQAISSLWLLGGNGDVGKIVTLMSDSSATSVFPSSKP